MNYLGRTLTAPTPQREALPNKQQVRNNAGGYVFPVDNFTRLERFLVLGTEGGSYYVGERKLTLDNTKAIQEAIVEDGFRAVNIILEFSTKGRIPRESTALYALALAASKGSLPVQRYALLVMPQVARTGSHLLEFVSYIDLLRGWGRQVKKAVGQWYFGKSPSDAAYQVVKYRNRAGWTHRDVLRSIHQKPPTEFENLFHYIARQPEVVGGEERILQVFQVAQQGDAGQVIALIRDHGLSWEMVTSEHLKHPDVWAALAQDMPPTALIRNLATLTRLGVLKPLLPLTKRVCARLVDVKELKRARVHPMEIFLALMTYKSGKAVRGNSSWVPIAQVTEALEKALYLSFDNVEPTGKRFYLGMDVSGSMGWNFLAGAPTVTAREAAAVLTMVIARAESNYYAAGFSHEMVPLDFTAVESLQEVVSKVSAMRMGRTDCALPMLDAIEKGLEVDCFVILTDNESYAGDIHASEALRMYRQKTGIPAKLVVVAMTAESYSIADPDDAGSMDVVGFDAGVPKILADFVTNE